MEKRWTPPPIGGIRQSNQPPYEVYIMARIRGPLLSISAQGQIGKTLVSGSWRGVPYMRQYVVPANPRTTAQTNQRDMFGSLDGMYKRMLALAQAPFDAGAKGKPLTARNLFLSANLKALKGETDMEKWVSSPGVLGGLPGESPTAAGGANSGEIDATIDIGQAPVDWENPTVTFLLIPARDPKLPMAEFVTEASETGAGASYMPPVTISHTFTGLTPSASYVVSMFPVWLRSDGTTAYGPSSTLPATATA